MSGRLFQGLQEGIERRLREHVYLVDDVDLEAAHLGSKADLVNQLANVVHRVV